MCELGTSLSALDSLSGPIWNIGLPPPFFTICAPVAPPIDHTPFKLVGCFLDCDLTVSLSVLANDPARELALSVIEEG